ncbi:MAG: biotin transporter BioY [Devosia sp.]|nr:biotin transporter BioY [Devosia sp.]
MSTRDLAYIALFAAIMAALAIFPPLMLPIGVPITAQSMGPMLAGLILGARRGGLSILLFVVLVAIGLPLLAGGRGGLGIVMGPTGGFIIGWIPAAFAIGWLTERFWNGLNPINAFLIAVFGSVVVSYAVGIPWTAAVAGIGLDQAFWPMLAFVPGDCLKAAVAVVVALTVKRAYPLIPARS